MKVMREQLQAICDIAEAAGREIIEVYGGEFKSWNKDDQSPVTEADLRADSIIRTRLAAEFAGVFILSEESSSGALDAADTFFLVDPLDGTKEFLKRNGEFTVNIALVHRGEPVAGVVFAPALREMFSAARGLGGWKDTGAGAVSLCVAKFTEGRALRVMGSRSHAGEDFDSWLATLPAEHNFVAAGSSLKFCRIAEGLADIYPRFGPTSQWDTAAAQCILEMAGGSVTDLAGMPLSYGLDRPILNPEFVAVGDKHLQKFVRARDAQKSQLLKTRT